LRLLDLFCGAGGAAMGYSRAGFEEIVGVDLHPQPRYPFQFVQADALTFCASFGAGFDAIHASPPCQFATQMSARWRGKGGKTDTHVNWIPDTRAALLRAGRPYVIENVIGALAHMRTDLMLHGGMFGLGVHRPRRFESSVWMLQTSGASVKGPVGVYGDRPDGHITYRYRNNGNYRGKSLIRTARSIDEARLAMDIPWMNWSEIKEAIPPAYTEFLGRQLRSALEAA
jgi:DNA (cytosine-5)-methyltransferase 1